MHRSVVISARGFTLSPVGIPPSIDEYNDNNFPNLHQSVDLNNWSDGRVYVRFLPSELPSSIPGTNANNHPGLWR